MTKIAIVGNSHVGALKEGWQLVAEDFPNIDVCFFAVKKQVEEDCRLDERHYYGLSDRSASESVRAEVRQINDRLGIDLSDCEVILHAGREFPFQDFRALIYGYDIDGLVELGSPRRISAAAFEALSADAFDRFVPDGEWTSLLRSGTKLFLALKPVVSERAREEAWPFWKKWLESSERHVAYYRALLLTLERRLAGAGVGFVWQPESTLTPRGLTAEYYARNACRLIPSAPQPDNDISHMNAEFGALFLRAFFQRVGFTEPALAS